jgi:hypothetical protein
MKITCEGILLKIRWKQSGNFVSKDFFCNQDENLQSINIGVQGWRGCDYIKEKEPRRSML